MTPVDFRTLLRDELARRRARNPRYSMRAFARSLGTDHGAISRILGGARLTAPRIAALGPRLGLTAAQLAGACLHEHMAVLARLTTRPGFRPDVRWLAPRTSLTLDELGVALHYLLFTRRLAMTSTSTWELLA